MKGHKVLIVEDDPDLRDMLAMAARELLGVTVETRCGTEGVSAQVKNQRPWLIVMNVSVPGSLQLLRALKADPATRTVPVVGMHSRGLARCSEVLALGYDGCFGDGNVLDMERLARGFFQQQAKESPG